jgi:hypothetical protein
MQPAGCFTNRTTDIVEIADRKTRVYFAKLLMQGYFIIGQFVVVDDFFDSPDGFFNRITFVFFQPGCNEHSNPFVITAAMEQDRQIVFCRPLLKERLPGCKGQ